MGAILLVLTARARRYWRSWLLLARGGGDRDRGRAGGPHGGPPR